ncbi:unnamed protein product [Oppiella nova]|uniref:Solute-binding protein family 3/N-terminal domain-containing protein n=1 Tax=Oppiella nova TaxID=334625 RepID=A0A7R9LAV8_9ACAR|nr:unnamed protein product [Oppiella nova]CAG2161711.1 unnamed protein product [Oppiella nova]
MFLNWPYADRLSGKYEGYAIDLMNEIADIVGFEYRLYFSPDGAYGVVRDNKVNGMIGEVYSGDLADSDIKYGTYKMGSTYNLFSESNDPTIRRMYTHMTRHPEDLVNNAKEGVDKVNGSRFAFLVESSFAEFLTGMYCDLTFIVDTNNYFPRQYAIALPKDSSYLNKFDHAIRRLKKSGQLDRIKGRYTLI